MQCLGYSVCFCPVTVLFSVEMPEPIQCVPLFCVLIAVIETLLCYLELHAMKWIENLQPIFANCSVQFYGGRAQMLSVAKKVQKKLLLCFSFILMLPFWLFCCWIVLINAKTLTVYVTQLDTYWFCSELDDRFDFFSVFLPL